MKNIEDILAVVKKKAKDTGGAPPPFLMTIPFEGPPVGFSCSGQCVGPHCLNELMERIESVDKIVAMLMIVAHNDAVYVAEGGRKKLTVWELKVYRTPACIMVGNEWNLAFTPVFEKIRDKLV